MKKIYKCHTNYEVQQPIDSEDGNFHFIPKEKIGKIKIVQGIFHCSHCNGQHYLTKAEFESLEDA